MTANSAPRTGRVAAGRGVLAGLVGLAALATAGTLTMVAAGTEALTGSPSRALAGGPRSADWGSGRVLLPGVPAAPHTRRHVPAEQPAPHGQLTVVPAVRSTEPRQTPSRPAQPVVVGVALGPAAPVVAPPAAPLTPPSRAGALPGGVGGLPATPEIGTGGQSTTGAPDGERQPGATAQAPKPKAQKASKAKPAKHKQSKAEQAGQSDEDKGHKPRGGRHARDRHDD